MDAHRYLYQQLVRHPVIDESNQLLIIETLRSIAELLIWGDQNETRFFECGLRAAAYAQGAHARLLILRGGGQCGEVRAGPRRVQLLFRKEHSRVLSAHPEPKDQLDHHCATAADTVNPVRKHQDGDVDLYVARRVALHPHQSDVGPRTTGARGPAADAPEADAGLACSFDPRADYLLSNNYVNQIICHKFDFSDEEVLAYYISFLKTLSLKLNKNTIHFFYNEACMLRAVDGARGGRGQDT